MATRFSGTLRLEIDYVRSTDSYNVEIIEVNDDARFASQNYIRLPPVHCGLNRTGQRAYDMVANAALGFASYEDEAIHVFAQAKHDSCDFLVRHLALVG